MTRYTAKQREDAATICAIMASSSTERGSRADLYFDAMDWSDRTACGLVREAYSSIPFRPDHEPFDPEEFAEAESWLRSGWSPGDTWTDADRRRAGLAVRR